MPSARLPAQNSTSGGPFPNEEETRLPNDASDLPTIGSQYSPMPASVPPNLSALAQRYEILAELGRGAMGQVFKARDRETGEMVALKLMNPEISSDQEMIERFKRELAFARKITHKNVCRVYEFNRAGDIAYTSMEFVEGENLRSVLKRFGSLPPKKGMDLGLQMCSGLKEAHAQGIVHRDLKPENVMIDSRGDLKIMDFGIARSINTMTRATGAVTGTPAYMAPEQALGKQVDYRTDIYALGLIFYEMFTGRRAFSAENSVALALKQLNESPVPPRELEPAISTSLNQAILKCLEREPEKRFQSVSDLEKSLLASGGLAVAEAIPASSTRISPGRATKKGRLMPALIFVIVILAATAILWWRSSARKSTEAPTVEKIVEESRGPSIASPPPMSVPAPPPAVHPSDVGAPGVRAGSKAQKSVVPAKQSSSKNIEESKKIAEKQNLSPEAATAASPGLQPYILVGRFARSAVAQNAAKKVEALGLPAVVLPRHNPVTNGDFFAVFSGPFVQNNVDDAMQKLQAGGFTKIVAVKGLGPVKQTSKP